ncbi:MAG: PP2C family serine/threonine-protein phosphatase [Blastocatellia bacterium]|nr:PP2C family serine/threonine-protein phosphatase [Blastocatellia bacterium]
MWKYAFASVAGTGHAATDVPCQDNSHCETFQLPDGSSVLVAAVSDGASSASRADRGSYLACTLFVENVKRLLMDDDSQVDFVSTWIAEFREAVRAEAEADGIKVSDFACTFVSAVISHDEAVFFHLGDGAIVISRREDLDQYQCVSWPQQGEYANTTSFITDDDALDKITSGYETHIEELAIFSDGIQHMVLDYESQSAHAPFFTSVFTWLREVREADGRNLSYSLRSFLDSEKVNSRTDDDKTLVIATRRFNSNGTGSETP